MAEDGYVVTRTGKYVDVLMNGNLVARGSQKSGKGSMYTLDINRDDLSELNSIKTMTLQNAHESLGHIAPSKIIEMEKTKKYNIILSNKSFQDCDSCSAVKLVSPDQPKEPSRTTTVPGEFVNADVIGPINDVNPDAKYISTLIDRATSYASTE